MTARRESELKVPRTTTIVDNAEQFWRLLSSAEACLRFHMGEKHVESINVLLPQLRRCLVQAASQLGQMTCRHSREEMMFDVIKHII